MSDYLLPTNTDWVTASWQDHKDRTPPSSEPGTDYGCAYGSPVVAADNGVVGGVQTGPAGATGRYVTVNLDDGRTTRSLHLSRTDVVTGQRVARGQQLGLSGASGNGSDWWYGPHLHETLWPGAIWAAPTIDFELYVGEDEDMTPEQAAMLERIAGDVKWLKDRVGGSVENGDPTLTHVTAHATDWLEQRIGGSTSSKDISYEIDDIHKAVVRDEAAS